MRAISPAKTSHGLIPISELSSRYCSPARRNPGAFVFETLKNAASAAQNGEPQPFYSIRSVSKHFNMPQTGVTRIFDRLKAEGLITTAWGFRTILQPARLNRDVKVRGILAMLSPTEPFNDDVTAHQYFRAIWAKLWSLNFAARVWLYDRAESNSCSFVDEVLHSKPDGIVWLMPHKRVTLLAHGLLDCGIRVIRLTAAMTYVQMLEDVTRTFG